MVFYSAFNSIPSYYGDSSHYSCLSWVSPVLGWGSEVSFQRILAKKNPKKQRIQCGSNPEHFDYESLTLPLSHARSLDSYKHMQNRQADMTRYSSQMHQAPFSHDSCMFSDENNDGSHDADRDDDDADDDVYH